jgi:hypothetical protein
MAGIQYGVWRVAPFLATFKEYPPSQRPASFNVDQMVDTLMKSPLINFRGAPDNLHEAVSRSQRRLTALLFRSAYVRF